MSLFDTTLFRDADGTPVIFCKCDCGRLCDRAVGYCEECDPDSTGWSTYVCQYGDEWTCEHCGAVYPTSVNFCYACE